MKGTNSEPIFRKCGRFVEEPVQFIEACAHARNIAIFNKNRWCCMRVYDVRWRLAHVRLEFISSEIYPNCKWSNESNSTEHLHANEWSRVTSATQWFEWMNEWDRCHSLCYSGIVEIKWLDKNNTHSARSKCIEHHPILVFTIERLRSVSKVDAP